MSTKTKIGLASFAVLSFLLGGFALNAYEASAAPDGGNSGWGFGHMMSGAFGKMMHSQNGFQGEMPELTDEMKAQMEEHREERQALKDEWQDLTEEERQAKLEELRANAPEGLTPGFKGMHVGAHKGLMKWLGSEDVDFHVTNIDNGVQVTVTSDNADIVSRIQDMASKMPGMGDEDDD